MSKVVNELSRRNLIRYLGNSILFLPVLRTFHETQVFGADAAPRRAIFFYFPSGFKAEEFNPAAGAIGSLPAMTNPLSKVKNDIIIIKDSTYKTGNSHQGGVQYSLTGLADTSPRGPSLDYVLGEKFKSTIPVKRLGICSNFEGGGDPQSCTFNSEGKLEGRENNPTKAFLDLFGGAAPIPSPATPGSPVKPPAPTSGLIYGSRKSLFDDNLEQLKSLQNKLGTIEKSKLDSHVNAIRELERRLDAMNAPMPGGTTAGGVPTAGGLSGQCTKKINQPVTFDPKDASYDAPYGKVAAYNNVADMMNEIAIQALACRVTNVIVIQHGHSVFEMGFANGQPAAGGKGQHSSSHFADAGGNNEGPLSTHIANQQYFMTKFANLVEGLGKCTEGDKSVLFHSIIMAFSELGNSAKHDMSSVPIVLAGQAGGYFKTGRCVDAKGEYHNKTLVSICQSFGMANQGFGDTDPAMQDPKRFGPMPGLTA